MTVRKIAISVQDWILNEVIGNVNNRSARMEELILKGWVSEQKALIQGKNPEQQKGSFFNMVELSQERKIVCPISS